MRRLKFQKKIWDGARLAPDTPLIRGFRLLRSDHTARNLATTDLWQIKDWGKSSSAVAERPRNASCLFVVSFSSTIPRAPSFVIVNLLYRLLHLHLHLHSTPQLGGFTSECSHDDWCGKTRMVWLPDGENTFHCFGMSPSPTSAGLNFPGALCQHKIIIKRKKLADGRGVPWQRGPYAMA